MKTRSLVFLILGTVAVLGILAVAACGGFFYFGLKSTDEKLSPLFDEIFAAIEAGKLVDTYDTLTVPEFRKLMSREQYETAGKTIKDRLGRLETKSIKSFKMHSTGDKSYVEATYSATFEKGTALVLLNTMEVDGQRKIAGFFVKSAALAAPAPTPGEKAQGADGQPAGEPANNDKPAAEKPVADPPADQPKAPGEPQSTEAPQADAGAPKE